LDNCEKTYDETLGKGTIDCDTLQFSAFGLAGSGSSTGETLMIENRNGFQKFWDNLVSLFSVK
jgi:hypothetical protein